MNDTFEILRFAPAFDHNMSLLARAMEVDLEDDSEYIESLTHKMGGDFVRVGKGLLDNDIRKRLKALVDVPLKLHEKYNLPKERTDFLDHLIQKHIRDMLA